MMYFTFSESLYKNWISPQTNESYWWDVLKVIMLWNRSFSNSPNVSNNPLELILNLQARKSNSIN